MATEWPQVPLGKVVKNFDSRRVPLSSRERETRHGIYPYYGATGVMDYVDDYLFEGLHLLVAEDGSVERPDGKPFLQLVDGKFWVSNHAHVLKGATDEDTRFIYYALLTVAIRPYMTGSVQAKLSQGNLNRIPTAYPSSESDRHAIAHVLGTLDDKIELNRRMNETLEAMARALFKSWFVDFDPVHAKAAVRREHPNWTNEQVSRAACPNLKPEIAALFPDSFVDSELGEIPKGWRDSTVGQNFRLTMGQSPPGSTYNEIGEGVPFYQGRTDFEFRFPTRRVFCTAPTRFAETGDTLVSVRAPVGDVNMANERCAVGRGVAAIRHRSGSRSFTYYSMKYLGKHFDQFEAEGTVFGCINKSDFERLPFVSPEPDILTVFEQIVSPLDDRLETNECQSLILASIREVLLPKLISGELRVPDAGQ